jgi:F-type H+-transporting ATPase subunit b
MLINWFTVFAQAVNFLILVWLLKRFLYKPILHAIDEREKGIASQLAQAEAKKAEAQRDRDDFQHKSQEFDQQRAALLKKATDEAAAQRQQLLDEARKDADSLLARRQESLRSEQQNLSQEIIRRTQQEVFAIARKALADLAAVSLEQRMVEIFVQRLRALAGPAKEQLTAALKSSTNPPRVRSAFDLPPAQRSTIENAVKESFGAEIQVRFETAPEVVSGVELSTNGQKVAWSVADYLATLEKSAAELLHQDAKPASKPEAEPKLAAKIAVGPKPTSEPDHQLEPVPSARKAAH